MLVLYIPYIRMIVFVDIIQILMLYHFPTGFLISSRPCHAVSLMMSAENPLKVDKARAPIKEVSTLRKPQQKACIAFRLHLSSVSYPAFLRVSSPCVPASSLACLSLNLSSNNRKRRRTMKTTKIGKMSEQDVVPFVQSVGQDLVWHHQNRYLLCPALLQGLLPFGEDGRSNDSSYR